MNYRIEIDKTLSEEILICAREKTKLVEEIEQLILSQTVELIGYSDKNAVRLDVSNVCCFVVDVNKVFAITDTEKLQIKLRLYQLEDILTDNFVKINQSCIANVKKICRFDASFTGVLTVVFENGYKDYVSRRQMKYVKERFGL